MLESMITPPPPKGIEPDYPYEDSTMIRIVKEPVAMVMTYTLSVTAMTIHYGDQNAPSSGTLSTSSSQQWTVPANVTEFFLKRPEGTTGVCFISGPEITEITWNPKFECTILQFYNSYKLRSVSPYLPGRVNNLGNCFNKCYQFNSDISSWDTSGIINLNGFLRDASIFNQDISGWDNSVVTNMGGMFYGASSFNQDISTWNTGSVTSMVNMFRNASVFNQNLSNWDVSKVTTYTGFDTGATAWQAANKPKFV